MPKDAKKKTDTSDPFKDDYQITMIVTIPYRGSVSNQKLSPAKFGVDGALAELETCYKEMVTALRARANG